MEHKLYDGLKANLNNTNFNTFINSNLMSSQKVGPTIADDIKSTSWIAAIVSIVLIFLYIVARFRKWQYGMGAIIATIHDVMFVLAIFSLFSTFMPFSLEIDQTFIAAILTIIGYSLNDTVVVFDRIREYLSIRKNQTMEQVINSAINDTLSRTLMTSLVTFLVVFVLFIFGGEVIRGFSFAMLLGVVVGTYSSIFIATPVVIDLDKDSAKVIK
jgi:SecD/SecF fusion protein